ncbi:nucleoporin nup211-like [Nicotiana sylvestris]|uniref:nucleoporin nup211-like n=1 Tax=Nicotiana sylvestris TaxID=4096 RepID=UPI00388C7F6A
MSQEVASNSCADKTYTRQVFYQATIFSKDRDGVPDKEVLEDVTLEDMPSKVDLILAFLFLLLYFCVRAPYGLCLGDAVELRLAPTDEVEVPKQSKERKRRRESFENPLKPKKSVTRRPKADTTSLSPEMAQCLREQEEEEEDDCMLDVVIHKRAFSKSQADLARCEAELKKTLEERDVVKALYAKKEIKIHDLRVELTQACQGQAEYVEKFQQKADLKAKLRKELKMKENETLGLRQGMHNLASEKETLREQLASLEHQLQGVKEDSQDRGLEIEELKAKSAAELAKAKSDVAAIMASYRADVEAASARAREISYMVEVKLSSALEHARRQSWRMTLEEIHACGFDLSANIEVEKILEEEDVVLLSDEDDSAGVSESEGDGDEVLEGEDLEDATLEDATPGDAAAKDVTPKLF